MHIHVPAMDRVITIIKNMLSSDLECATMLLILLCVLSEKDEANYLQWVNS